MRLALFLSMLFLSLFGKAQSFDFLHTWTNSTTGYFNCEIDNSGDVFLLGSFRDTFDLDPSSNEYLIEKPYSEAGFFLSRFSPEGDLIWSKFFGYNFNCFARELHIDAKGDLYITGQFKGDLDFDPDSTEYILSSQGVNTGFIFKLDNSGKFVWAHAFDSRLGSSMGTLVTTDQKGNLYLAGKYSGNVEFDLGFIDVELKSALGSDAYLLKYSPELLLLWSESISWQGGAVIRDLKIDSGGNVYAVGNFSGEVDFDEGTRIKSYGNSDIFIAKHKPNLNQWDWYRTYGGTEDDFVTAIEFGKTESEILIAGNFEGNANFGERLSPIILNSPHPEGFFMNINSSGEFGSVHKLNSKNHGRINAMRKDGFDNLVFLGEFGGELPIPANSTLIESDSSSALFIARSGLDGVFSNAFTFAEGTQFNTNAGNENLLIDPTGNLFVTGYFAKPAIFQLGQTSEQFFVESPLNTLNYFFKIGDFLTAVSEKTNLEFDAIAYPNPSSGILNFKNSKNCFDLKIYSPSGQMMKILPNQCGSSNLSFLAKGNYLVFVKNEETSGIFQWIKF